MLRLDTRSMRDRLAALAVALAVALAIAASGWLLLDAAWTESAPSLDEATRLGAEAVGRALSAQIERALGLGIPLDRLVKVEDYLRTVVAAAPQVDAIALLDETGRKVFATRDGVSGLTFPVHGGGQQATLVLSTESPFLNSATVQLELFLAATALLGGFIAFLLTSLFLALYLAPARARLALALGRAAHGDFAVAIPTAGRGRATVAFRALARRIEPVYAAARRLADSVATVRAIDFDGSLSKRLEPILAEVASTRALADIEPGETTRTATPGPAAIVSRLLVLVGLYAGTWPLLANFAIDRGTGLVLAPWWPVIPLFAEGIAVLIGALGAHAARPVLVRGVAATGWALSGLAMIAVFWCRSYELFIALRATAGLGLGLALTPLVRDPRLLTRPATVVALIGVAAVLFGPMFGGLVAEAFGRRGAFALLGLLLLVGALFATAAPGTVTAGHTPPRLTLSGLGPYLILLFGLMPLGAFALILVPAGPGFDSYGAGGALIAASGLAAVVAPRIAKRLATCAAGLAIVASAALWLPAIATGLPETGRWIATALLLGLGTGSLGKAFASEVLRHPALVVIGLALGAGLVPLGTALAPTAMVAILPVGLLVALLAAGISDTPRHGRGSAP